MNRLFLDKSQRSRASCKRFLPTFRDGGEDFVLQQLPASGTVIAVAIFQTPPLPLPPLVHEGDGPDGGGRRDERRAEQEEEGVRVAKEVSEDVVEDAVLVLVLLLLQDDYWDILKITLAKLCGLSKPSLSRNLSTDITFFHFPTPPPSSAIVI